MVLSNFPNGVTSFGVPVIGAGEIPTTSGTYFFVDSNTGSDGNDGSWEAPFATVDAAIGHCTANKGDVIVCKASHAETLVAASAITFDVAGVTLYSLGTGSKRAAFTFGTLTTASIVVSAANVSILNVIGIGNVDALINPFNITGSDFKGIIEWRDATNLKEAICAVKATTVSRLTLDLNYLGFTSGSGVTDAITLTAVTGANIQVQAYGQFTTAVVEFLTTACTDITIRGTTYNTGITTGAKNVVDTAGSSTWYAEISDESAGAILTGGSATSGTLNAASPSAVADALYGTAGIASWAAGAAAANNVSISESLRYAQENIINGTGTVLATNTSLYGVLAGATGVPTWPTAAAYANNVSLAEVLGYVQDAVRNGTGTALPTNTSLFDMTERGVTTGTAVIGAGTATIFTVAGGPILIMNIIGVCVSSNDGTATLLKFAADPTDGAATDICAASASLASVAAGGVFGITGTLTDPGTNVVNGTRIGQATSVLVPAGIIQSITSGGATTGTWYFALRYKPLRPGVTVTAAY